jgi:excisionase family DNA binding protein
MERVKRIENVPVIREELSEPRWPAELDATPFRKIDRALAAAASNLAEVREAFEMLCGAIPGGAGDAVRALPVLLTVPQVCKLLGYHKTKVYELMKRGLLPYVVETKTGHRRVEYRAVQHLVKRLRGGRLEGKAS